MATARRRRAATEQPRLPRVSQLPRRRKPLRAPPTSVSGGTAGTPSGRLVVSLPQRIVNLDPLGTSAAEEPVRIVAQHVFDTLVVRDIDSGEYRPSVATKWETSSDGTTWSFTLRDDVKFHDDTELTATDVQASLERLVEVGGPFAALWATLDHVTATSDTTVDITTKGPLGTVLANVALLSIAPAAGMAQEGFFNKPIGSGPFKVVRYEPDSELELEANDNYWGSKAGVKTLIFRDIPELAARVTALVTGEIDFTYRLPPDQAKTLQENDSIEIVTSPSYRYYFIWMNASREPYTDKRVRQAMIYALDIDTMVETLLSGVAERMDAPIPSTVFGYAPQTPYAYDPEKAKSLLAEAGYPNGFETNMIWNPGSDPQDREIAQALFSYWNAIGVKVEDRQQERAKWLEDLLALNWDLDFQGNTVTTGDADFTLRRLYLSSANRTGYANPELDKLLQDAAATVDQQERKELYARVCKHLWDEAVGIYPFQQIFNFAYQKRLRGFKPSPSVPLFTTVTVEE